MASWNQDDQDDFFKPPRSPRHLIPQPPQAICPDSETNVAQQAEDVFKNFIYQRYRQDNIRQQYDATPRAPELVNFTQTPLSPTAEIGRQLARIGDDINERYSDVFGGMIRNLNVNPDTAYESFANVARKLFENGINWGRVVTLLFFGYRIALTVLKTNVGKFSSFMRRIVEYVVKFILKEKIARWIAEHGGWRAALTYVPSASTETFIAVTGLALLSVALVFYIHKYS